MYSISRERFLDSPPQDIRVFRFGNLVDRESFTSFSILSFRLSKGSLWAQRIVWQFTQEQTGFDFQATYDNYLNAGGFRALSNSETDMIVKAYIAAGHSAAYKPLLDFELLDPAFKLRTTIGFDEQISMALSRIKLTSEELKVLRSGKLDQMLYLSKARISKLLRTQP